jgi:hypothetical protein
MSTEEIFSGVWDAGKLLKGRLIRRMRSWKQTPPKGRSRSSSP